MDQLRIAVIGDIHYGHPKIDPIKLYKELHLYFFPEAAISDMVVIAGDFFDSLLDLSSHHTLYAMYTLRDLISLQSSGCIVRFLSGTYSHDRQQYLIYQALSGASDTTPEVKWYKDITAEKLSIRDHTYTFAYIPDNLQGMDKYDISKILSKKLQELNSRTYDAAFGHGTFDFGLGNVAHIPITALQAQHHIYTVDMFQDIADIVVFGHIHTHCKKEHVYYTGSFTRFQHNEEEPKGFLVLTRNSNKWKVKFIPNPDSTLFLTYTIHSTMDTQEHLQHFQQWISKYPIAASTVWYLRLQVPPTDTAHIVKEAITAYLSTQYPEVHITIKKTAKDSKETVPLHLEKVDYEEFLANIPTPSNISERIYQYLQKLPEYDEQVLSLDEINSIVQQLTS